MPWLSSSITHLTGPVGWPEKSSGGCLAHSELPLIEIPASVPEISRWSALVRDKALNVPQAPRSPRRTSLGVPIETYRPPDASATLSAVGVNQSRYHSRQR